MKKPLLVGIAALVLMLIVTAVVYVTARGQLRGAIIDPPAPVAEIHLTDQDGQPFALSSLRGKVVLLYFGYTNCPDECPLTMAHLKLAVEALGARAQDVRVIMVTTDPARDTQAVLKAWLAKFSPDFIGLYGTPDQMAQVWRDYGVTVESGGETHSYFVYVIDRSGNLRETFLPDTSPTDVTADVGLLLSGR